jgi:hypothetical protein
MIASFIAAFSKLLLGLASLLGLTGLFILADAPVGGLIDWVAGGSTLVVSAAIIGWILKSSKRLEAIAKANEERQQRRIDELEEDLLAERDARHEAERKYDEERRLRIGLEAQGIANRRHDPLAIETNGDTK